MLQWHFFFLLVLGLWAEFYLFFLLETVIFAFVLFSYCFGSTFYCQFYTLH